MQTKTVSTRLAADELMLLDELATRSGQDRAAMTKTLLRRGMAELRYEQAVSVYRTERVTLSRAAEMAAMSAWDFIARMHEQDLIFNYGVRELEEDLDGQL